MVRLRALPAEALAAQLRDRLSLSPERAAMIASFAEGRIGQAMHLAQSNTASDEIERVLDFAVSLPDAPRARALRVAEQMRKLAAQIKALVGEEPTAEGGDDGEATTGKEKTGRRQLAAVFDLMVVFYRDLLTLRVGAGKRWS